MFHFMVVISLTVSMAGSDESPSNRPFAAALGMEFVRIPPGSFAMGSNDTDVDLQQNGLERPVIYDLTDESPVRTVRMSAFRMQTTEVTRGQFAEFVRSTNYRTDAEKKLVQSQFGLNLESGVIEQHPTPTWRNPGFPQTDKHPVVNVSWNDADAFATWLTSESKKKGETVRYLLPTEAQFEYAMRAGATTRFATGDNPQSLDGHANVADTSLARLPWLKNRYLLFRFDDGVAYTAVVGSYKKNTFGLCDMNGNVEEWCRDWYDAEYYAAAHDQDPKGPNSGAFRVSRGGYWGSSSYDLRCSARSGTAPGNCGPQFGFRLVSE